MTPEQRASFPPICPDFVVELRSPSDRLSDVQEKMQEYMDNGARLGRLIDPMKKVVEIYRQGREKEMLRAPRSVSGEEVLPGFKLDLQGIL